MGQFQSIQRKLDLPVLVGSDSKAAGIFGCVVLSTGNVLFTDYYNLKVKVVNVDTGEVISSLMFFSGPSDVTTVAHTRAAVTLPDENKIQLFHVVQRDTDMSFDYSIRVQGRCVGIDFDYYRLIVSFLDPPKIQLINLDGVVLRTIQRDPRGFFLFDSPTSVFLSRDRNHFYCCDLDRNQVLKIRMDGTVDGVNADISRPRKIIELPDDNVLVVSSDPESNSVHHLSPDLRVQKAILASGDGIIQPRALCLRQKGNKLFDLIISNQKGMTLSEYRMTFK